MIRSNMDRVTKQLELKFAMLATNTNHVSGLIGEVPDHQRYKLQMIAL